MNLKTYIDNLLKLVETNPEALTMEVVYSGDGEGNDYNTVNYTPSLGYYNSEDREFSSDLSEVEPEDEYGEVPVKVNSVCIN